MLLTEVGNPRQPHQVQFSEDLAHVVAHQREVLLLLDRLVMVVVWAQL